MPLYQQQLTKGETRWMYHKNGWFDYDIKVLQRAL